MSPAEASSSPEVSWSDLVFAYPGRRPVLNGLAHRLDGGGLTWLAGASGVGKSTLLRTINGLAPHFTGGAVGGRVRVAGRDPVRLGPAGMSPYVGFVAGDPEAREIAETVADELAYALERQGRPTAEILVRLHRALDAVGLAGFAGRRLSTLSGGERQRVAVAAAIVSGARVLALDEPTSQLDDVAAARVMDALESLSHAGVTVILAGHRARRLAPRVGAAMWLASGRAEAVDPAEAARRLAAAAPALDVPPGGAFGAVRIELRDLRFDWCVEGSGEDRSSDGGPDPLAALGEGRPMLDGVDLRVRAGEIVVLTGPSGAGKTTLLRLALGQLRPWEGEARMAGEAVTGRPLREVGRLVAYVPQEAGALLLADSVREELRLTRQGRGLEGRRAVPSDGLAGRGGAERREAEGEAEEIEDLLARLGLSSLAERYPRDLSTGERQRVVVAAMAAGRPAAMLLDEPTRGLDRAALVAVAAEIQALAAAGTAVLVATHDRRLWAAAHRRVALVAGALVDRPTAGTAGPTDEGV